MPIWFQPMSNWSRSTMNSAVSVTVSALAPVTRPVTGCGRLMPRTAGCPLISTVSS